MYVTHYFVARKILLLFNIKNITGPSLLVKLPKLSADVKILLKSYHL